MDSGTNTVTSVVQPPVNLISQATPSFRIPTQFNEEIQAINASNALPSKTSVQETAPAFRKDILYDHGVMNTSPNFVPPTSASSSDASALDYLHREASTGSGEGEEELEEEDYDEIVDDYDDHGPEGDGDEDDHSSVENSRGTEDGDEGKGTKPTSSSGSSTRVILRIPSQKELISKKAKASPYALTPKLRIPDSLWAKYDDPSLIFPSFVRPFPWKESGTLDLPNLILEFVPTDSKLRIGQYRKSECFTIPCDGCKKNKEPCYYRSGLRKCLRCAQSKNACRRMGRDAMKGIGHVSARRDKFNNSPDPGPIDPLKYLEVHGGVPLSSLVVDHADLPKVNNELLSKFRVGPPPPKPAVLAPAPKRDPFIHYRPPGSVPALTSKVEAPPPSSSRSTTSHNGFNGSEARFRLDPPSISTGHTPEPIETVDTGSANDGSSSFHLPPPDTVRSQPTMTRAARFDQALASGQRPAALHIPPTRPHTQLHTVRPIASTTPTLSRITIDAPGSSARGVKRSSADEIPPQPSYKIPRMEKRFSSDLDQFKHSIYVEKGKIDILGDVSSTSEEAIYEGFGEARHWSPILRLAVIRLLGIEFYQECFKVRTEGVTFKRREIGQQFKLMSRILQNTAFEAAVLVRRLAQHEDVWPLTMPHPPAHGLTSSLDTYKRSKFVGRNVPYLGSDVASLSADDVYEGTANSASWSETLRLALLCLVDLEWHTVSLEESLKVRLKSEVREQVELLLENNQRAVEECRVLLRRLADEEDAWPIELPVGK